MRRSVIVGLMILMGCTAGQGTVAAQPSSGSSAGSSSGGSRAGGQDDWLGGAPLQTRVYVGDDGETYVGVWLEAPEDAPARRERPPMAISLVVDTSGSMSGDKIRHARMAAQSMLESLQKGDRVSIYGFSDGVTEIAAPTRLNADSRRTLMQRIRNLRAGGGTNMYDGLSVAVSKLQEAPSSHPVRRVMMVSDGHANIGPSDPQSLGQVAARGTEWGTQVSAIGVGLDYDERTLGQVAVRSSGRMYHLEHSHQMANILEKELDMLKRTVARNAVIEIVPAPGVRILEGETMGAKVEDDRLRLSLGSVYAGQKREVLFRARVDTDQVGERPLATARLKYRKPESDDSQQVQSERLSYAVTRDRDQAQASTAPRVKGMVASHRASSAQLQAAQALNAGDTSRATDKLAKAEEELEEAAEQAPAPEARKLREQAQDIRRSRESARGASGSEARGAALENFDGAYEMQGY